MKSAWTLVGAALIGIGSTLSAAGADDAPFLAGEVLVAAFAGATLIGSNWAEYYAPDGVIVGKVRYLGIVRHFRGKWIVRDDHVCFEYERSEYNTCSKFRLLGDRMRHFASDGRPKKDGESRRLPGNRLERVSLRRAPPPGGLQISANPRAIRP